MWDLDLLPVIKSYFADVGIDMEIRKMDAATWNDFVRVGRKHDQLAYGAGTLGRTMCQLCSFIDFKREIQF